MKFVTFDNIDEIVSALREIREHELAYKRAQFFLKTEVQAHNILEAQKFLEEYVRNR